MSRRDGAETWKPTMSKHVTLPGTLPGLLRRGSPVAVLSPGNRWPGVVVHASSADVAPWVSWRLETSTAVNQIFEAVRPADLALDITDPTGQWHAHMWAITKLHEDFDPYWMTSEYSKALGASLHGEADPIFLRDLCLRLAEEEAG